MSGFVSKISAAGSKGWTGLQSLWERDNKTAVTTSHSGPSAEKTSLLSLALPSRHPRGSRLLSEDDDWGDSSPVESGETTDSVPSTTTQTLTPTTPTIPTNTKCIPRIQMKVEKVVSPGVWTSVSEDEGDVWLKADSAHRGILDTDKKKTARESKRPSPRFKHKLLPSSKGSDWKYSEKERGFSSLGKQKGPAFGKLLDMEAEEGEAREVSSAGCENKVWADDDENDAQWKMMEGSLGSKDK